MKMHRWTAAGVLACVFALSGLASSARFDAAFAQSYPDHAIKLMVPFPAGGPFDVIPRIVLQSITERYGWTFVVENRAGADGQIGIVAGKRAPADGYNLVAITSITHGAVPAYKLSPGYDAITDLAPIALLADASMALLVKKELPVNSVADLVALLKAQPNKFNFGSGGLSSQHFFAMAMLMQRAGLAPDIAAQVSFPGMAPAIQALMGGQIDFMFGSGGAAAQNIETGVIRAIAVSSDVRSPRLPTVPTMAEVGFPGFKVVAWVGLAAPAGTPRETIDLIAKLVNEALQRPEVRANVSAVDYDVRGSTPEGLASLISSDIGLYNKLIDDLKLPRR